jgi:hypothetical protein
VTIRSFFISDMSSSNWNRRLLILCCSSLIQLVIALTAGPIDGVFNKGNTPAFGIGAAFALICAVLAMVLLPKTRGTSNATVMAGGH